MKLKLIISAALIATLSTEAFAVTGTSKAQGANQAKLARQAKITMERAREIALQRAPGTIEESELEREHGKLVYSFDIRNEKGTITEVQVDAKKGNVVSVEEENAQQEAEEKKKDERRANSNKHP